MKIDVRRIQAEGLVLTQDFSAGEMDLEIEGVRFVTPLRIRAKLSRVTNAVTANVDLSAEVVMQCSRCLSDFKVDLRKALTLNYLVERADEVLDLGPDIREEVILDYPIQPLCKEDCAGLCARCGKNLNEGGCSCGTA